MTDADRRVATLAALFAPASAGALLGRLRAPAAPASAAHAARLATATRRERLAALAEALSLVPGAARGRADAAAALERSRIAALLRQSGGGPVQGEIHPALARLLRERIGR